MARRPVHRLLSACLAAAGLLAASRGRAAQYKSADGRLIVDAPEGWTQRPAPQGALVSLAWPGRSPAPAFEVSSLGRAMAPEELQSFVFAKAQQQHAVGSGLSDLREWASPDGWHMTYVQLASPNGDVFEGALSAEKESFWLTGRSLEEQDFLNFASALSTAAAQAPSMLDALAQARLRPAADLSPPAAAGAPPQALAGEGSASAAFSSAAALAALEAPQIAAHGRSFSIATPDGYARTPGSAPEAVLALQGPGLIEFYLVPGGMLPPFRLLYHIAYRVWPSLSLGAPCESRDNGGPARGQKGPSWSSTAQSGPQGSWLWGSFVYAGNSFWVLITGDEKQRAVVGAALESMAPGERAPGFAYYPEAPEPAQDTDAKPPSWALVPAVALALLALWYLLFGLARSKHAAWADDYEIPDMLSMDEPWTAHPLAGGARIVDRGGLFFRRLEVVRDGKATYRMVWRRPARLVALYSGVLAALIVLATAPPLGPGWPGYAIAPLSAALLAALLGAFLTPGRRRCCEIFNGEGQQIGEIVRFSKAGMPGETYKILGINGSMFGYIARGTFTPLLRKEWHVLDYGGQLLLSVCENPARALMRRLSGRLGGASGATLNFLEDGQPTGRLRSRGILRRRLELQFVPQPSRALVLIDPLVLVSLCAIVLARDPDAHIPWPLA